MSRKSLFKMIVTWGIMLLVLSMMVLNVSANELYENSEAIYVHDHADILSEKEELELEELARSLIGDFELNVLFLTSNDSQGKGIVAYTDDYMDHLFPVGIEDNICFVICMDIRKYDINTMGIAIEQLNDSEIKNALDKAEPSMISGDYCQALTKMASYCIPNIIGNKVATQEGVLQNLLWAMFAPFPLTAAIIFTIILIVILLSKHNSANRITSASAYMSDEDYEILNKNAVYLNSYETVQHDYYRPKESSGGGSSGGGSSHTSSSGRSHGGGGGRSF